MQKMMRSYVLCVGESLREKIKKNKEESKSLLKLIKILHKRWMKLEDSLIKQNLLKVTC